MRAFQSFDIAMLSNALRGSALFVDQTLEHSISFVFSLKTNSLSRK